MGISTHRTWKESFRGLVVSSSSPRRPWGRNTQMKEGGGGARNTRLLEAGRWAFVGIVRQIWHAGGVGTGVYLLTPLFAELFANSQPDAAENMSYLVGIHRSSYRVQTYPSATLIKKTGDKDLFLS